MKITMLGTGHAVVTKCYNTCFTIEENGSHFLVDAGGGNGILKVLEEKKISFLSIHDLYVNVTQKYHEWTEKKSFSLPKLLKSHCHHQHLPENANHFLRL